MLSIHTRSVKENCTLYIREYAIVVYEPMQKIRTNAITGG